MLQPQAMAGGQVNEPEEEKISVAEEHKIAAADEFENGE